MPTTEQRRLLWCPPQPPRHHWVRRDISFVRHVVATLVVMTLILAIDHLAVADNNSNCTGQLNNNTLQSNTSYVFKNCECNDTYPYIFHSTTKEAANGTVAELRNVEIIVQGGSCLVAIQVLSGPVVNVTLKLEGIRVGSIDRSMTSVASPTSSASSASSSAVTMLHPMMWFALTITRNVSLVMTNCTLFATLDNSISGPPLLYLQRPVEALLGVSVVISNGTSIDISSNVSLPLIGISLPILPVQQRASHISVHITGASQLHVEGDMLRHFFRIRSSVSYDGLLYGPQLLGIGCDDASDVSRCIAPNTSTSMENGWHVEFVVANATVRMKLRGDLSQLTTQWTDNPIVALVVCSTLIVQKLVIQLSDSTVSLSSQPNAYHNSNATYDADMIDLRYLPWLPTSFDSMSFVIENVTVEATAVATVSLINIRIAMVTVPNVTVRISDVLMTLTARGTYNDEKKVSAFLVRDVDSLSDTRIHLENVRANCSVLGLTSVASTIVLVTLPTTVHRLVIDTSSTVAHVIVDVVPLPSDDFVSGFAMLTGLISVNGGDTIGVVSTLRDMNIHASDSFLTVTHLATSSSLITVTSIIAGLNFVGGAVENCTLRFASSLVVVQLLAIYAPVVLGFNVTAAINAFDPRALNDTTRASTFVKTTVVVDNSSAQYSPSMPPPPPFDAISLVILPTSSFNCLFHVANHVLWSNAKLGVVTGLGPNVTLTNVSMVVEDVKGVSVVLFVGGMCRNMTMIIRRVYLQQDEVSSSKLVNAALSSTIALSSLSLGGPLTLMDCSIEMHNSSISGAMTLVAPNISVVVTSEKKWALHLGCNVWNSIPLPPQVIGMVNRSVVRYDRSMGNISGRIVVCPGFSTATASATLSMMPQLPEAVDSTIRDAANGAIAAVGAAGMAAAALGDMSSLLDAQMLVAMGQTVCGVPELRAVTGASQFLLSPFYPLGVVARVMGNAAVVAVVAATHTLAVWVLGRKSSSSQSSNLFRNHQQRATAAMERADVRLRYPNLSYGLGLLLAPGVANGVTTLFSGGEAGDVVAAVTGVVALGCGVWWRIRAGQQLLGRRRVTFRLYPIREIRSFVIPWALPIGQWQPIPMRMTHGRLRGAVRAGAEWLSSLSAVHGLVVQALLGVVPPTSWCTGVWAVVCVTQLITLAVILRYRPGRAPLSDGLNVCGLACGAAIQIVTALKQRDDDNGHGDDGETVGVLTALAAVSTMVSILKSCHLMLVLWWESRKQAAGDTEPQQTPPSGNAMLLLPLQRSICSSSSGSATRKKNARGHHGPQHAEEITDGLRTSTIAAMTQREVLQHLLEWICVSGTNQRTPTTL